MVVGVTELVGALGREGTDELVEDRKARAS
jgi:hypothetical protein